MERNTRAKLDRYMESGTWLPVRAPSLDPVSNPVLTFGNGFPRRAIGRAGALEPAVISMSCCARDASSSREDFMSERLRGKRVALHDRQAMIIERGVAL